MLQPLQASAITSSLPVLLPGTFAVVWLPSALPAPLRLCTNCSATSGAAPWAWAATVAGVDGAAAPVTVGRGAGGCASSVQSLLEMLLCPLQLGGWEKDTCVVAQPRIDRCAAIVR